MVAVVELLGVVVVEAGVVEVVAVDVAAGWEAAGVVLS